MNRNDGGNPNDGTGGRGPEHESRAPSVDVLRRAMDQLSDLTGRDSEALIGLNRIDGGWEITVEMIELERIPSSTSVLAAYQARLDGDGNLLEYEQTRRYIRSRADGE